jgi:hypothetical protein
MIEWFMVISPTEFRKNLYKLLDQILRSGQPIEIEWAGGSVLVLPKNQASKLSRLVKRKGFKGTTDRIAGMDWSKSLKPNLSDG